MQKLGKEITSQEVHDMLAQHDTNGDGVLSFQEFKAIFFGGEEIEQADAPSGEAGPAME